MTNIQSHLFSEIPGSKSIAQRALICAALCATPTILKNIPNGDDVQSLMKALSQCGIEIKKIDATTFEIIPSQNSAKISANIFVGHGGTPFRFLLSFLCSIPGTQTLDGSARLRERPMKPLIQALQKAGAAIADENFPLNIGNNSITKEITVDASDSSQFLSSLLLSAKSLGIEEIQVIGNETSSSYLELTKKVLADFGIKIIKNSQGYSLEGSYISPGSYAVEPDWASAGYILGACLLQRISGKIPFLKADSLQPDAGILSVLHKMGLETTEGGDDFEFSAKNLQSPGIIDCELFPDSAQTIAVLSAFCEKTKTTLTGLHTLPLKECNRIEALVSELKKMGIKTESTNKTITVFGGIPKAASIETFHDHRMGMAFGMAQVSLPDQKIDDPAVVSKSFPAFWNELAQAKKPAKKIAVIGDPIHHSLTPLLYNAAFAETGKNLTCERRSIPAANIQEFLANNQYSGLAITAPHKRKSAKFSDTIIGTAAKKIQRINSLRYDVKNIGANTDIIGIREVLAQDITSGQNIVILGAGDTAVSLLEALNDFDVSISLFNRTTEKAHKIAKKYSITVLEDVTEIEDLQPDVLISTLPFDAEPHFSENFFNNVSMIFCIGYDAKSLPEILERAEHAHKTIRTGGDLLLAQWQHQFEFLFGKKPPLKSAKNLLNAYTPLTQ